MKEDKTEKDVNLKHQNQKEGELLSLGYDGKLFRFHNKGISKLIKLTKKYYKPVPYLYTDRKQSIEKRLSLISNSKYSEAMRSDLLSILHEVLITKMLRKRKNDLLINILYNIHCTTEVCNIFLKSKNKTFVTMAKVLLQ